MLHHPMMLALATNWESWESEIRVLEYSHTRCSQVRGTSDAKLYSDSQLTSHKSRSLSSWRPLFHHEQDSSQRLPSCVLNLFLHRTSQAEALLTEDNVPARLITGLVILHAERYVYSVDGSMHTTSDTSIGCRSGAMKNLWYGYIGGIIE